jgi:hypothetical protein
MVVLCRTIESLGSTNIVVLEVTSVSTLYVKYCASWQSANKKLSPTLVPAGQSAESVGQHRGPRHSPILIITHFIFVGYIMSLHQAGVIINYIRRAPVRIFNRASAARALRSRSTFALNSTVKPRTPSAAPDEPPSFRGAVGS